MSPRTGDDSSSGSSAGTRTQETKKISASGVGGSSCRSRANELSAEDRSVSKDEMVVFVVGFQNPAIKLRIVGSPLWGSRLRKRSGGSVRGRSSRIDHGLWLDAAARDPTRPGRSPMSDRILLSIGFPVPRSQEPFPIGVHAESHIQSRKPSVFSDHVLEGDMDSADLPASPSGLVPRHAFRSFRFIEKRFA